jgi:hypothetical protein
LPPTPPAKTVALGICEGAPEVVVAAASNPDIKAIACVSGHYREYDNDVALIGGLELIKGETTKESAEARLKERKELAAAALEKYEKTGEVEYIPIVDPERKDVALPWKPIWDFYHGWADRGLWENRVALMGYVKYLQVGRRRVSAAGVKVDPQKVPALADWEIPRDAHEVRSFYYFGRFGRFSSNLMAGWTW